MGATALAEALATNTVLKCLNLNYSDIGCVGARALAGALAVNGWLTVLDFFDTGLEGPDTFDTDAASEALARRVRSLLERNKRFPRSLFRTVVFQCAADRRGLALPQELWRSFCLP